MARGKHPRSLAALVTHQFPPGVSGNAGGSPKTKPLTDGMRLLLHGQVEEFLKLPKPLKLIIGRWYGQAWSSPYGMATLLERIEGRVPQPIEHKELPTPQFIMQVIQQPHTITASPSPPPAYPAQPSTNGKSKQPHVEEVEAVPVDEDEEDE